MRADNSQDLACIKDIALGDNQALAALYSRYGRVLLGYLTHLIGDRSMAEDLVQEVFLVVWRDIVDCQDPTQDLLPWYVNGTLEAGDREVVEAHLRGCIARQRREAVYWILAEELTTITSDASLPGVTSLLAQLSYQQGRQRGTSKPFALRPSLWWPWLLLRAQEKVVRREIWVASVLVMTLRTLVTLTTHGPYSPSGAGNKLQN